jgi:phosphoglycolate phosphatase-like HAD superfamily hydrolase
VLAAVIASDAAFGDADAAFRAAIAYLERRFAAIHPLDGAALPADRGAALVALDAWGADAASNWRAELVRWYEAHAPVLLSPEPAVNGALRRARRAGTRVVVASPLPRAAVELYLSHLGVRRLVEAVTAEEDGDPLAAARRALGDDGAPVVATREELQAALA